MESGWTFFFFLLPQPVTSHCVRHHQTRRIFRCVPLHQPVETWAISLQSSMPRRKASERDQPHRRRSRNGCLNCRRRKIRCDEKAPSCSYCIARGLTCSRGGVVLKWEAEYADNGLAFGRQGVGPTAYLQACLRGTDYLYRYGANTESRNQTAFAWTKSIQNGYLCRP